MDELIYQAQMHASALGWGTALVVLVAGAVLGYLAGAARAVEPVRVGVCAICAQRVERAPEVSHGR